MQDILARVSTGPELGQLGVTCALEHFTALLGSMLLTDPRLLEGAHPAMEALWRWHAAEENEHKTVAFDVYKAAGGTYPMRVSTMIGATVIFWAKVIEQQARMMRASGILFSLDEWRALGRYLFVEPGGMLALIRLYFEYYRPDFHPSHIDSNGLLDAWRAEYEASPSTRSRPPPRARRRAPEAPATSLPPTEARAQASDGRRREEVATRRPRTGRARDDSRRGRPSRRTRTPTPRPAPGCPSRWRARERRG